MNFDDNEIYYPTELLCPITCNLLEDPVMTPDGHNFEKKKIYEWLDQKETNPLTQQHLTKNMLRPNPKLKETIQLIKGLTERNHHLEDVIRTQLNKDDQNQDDQNQTKTATVHQCNDCDGNNDKKQKHPIICDVCDQQPIIGNRYWKIHRNYDLCESDYQKLTEIEKKNYVCIKDPNSDMSKVARSFIDYYCDRD